MILLFQILFGINYVVTAFFIMVWFADLGELELLNDKLRELKASRSVYPTDYIQSRVEQTEHKIYLVKLYRKILIASIITLIVLANLSFL